MIPAREAAGGGYRSVCHRRPGKPLKAQVPPNIKSPLGDPHDRLKAVCAFDSDLARARGTVQCS